jgi:DNA-binding response OmpR family regulator
MSPYRALVVEDDPTIRKLVGKLLSRRGIEVDLAGDGRTAIEKLRQDRYSAVVLDLMIPEANGYEVIDAIREIDPQLPVAVVSAVPQQALTTLDRDIVRLVISKPFDVEELGRAVLQLCRDREG